MRENKISFAKYNICNLGHDFLEKYWDYEKNTEDPWNLSYGSGKKVFIYCQDQQYHGSYSVVCRDFSRGARCSYCKCRTIHPKDSFAQWGIDTFGEDFLEKYWDFKKNTEDPWNLSKTNKKKIWIFCQNKEYHSSYIISCGNFYIGNRCGYCQGTKIHPKDSFAQWGIDTLGEDFLEKYWDYERNTEDPWTLTKANTKKIYIKCQEKDYHGSYETTCNHFYNGCRCSYCNGKKVYPKDSFAQWGIDTLGEDFLEKYWDYERNAEDPWNVMPQSNKKIYIKCQEKYYHGSYETACNHFYNGCRCGYCNGKKVCPKDSFAQWGIDTLGEDFLEKYWDYERNAEDPWNVMPQSNKKIYIKCQKKEYHKSYETVCNFFYSGCRCSYCQGTKIHPKDSFAQWGIDTLGEDFLEKYWDYDKNNHNPWNVMPQSDKKVYIKCQKKEYHKSYETVCKSFYSGCRCGYCQGTKIHPKDSFAQWGIDTLGEDFLEKYWDYEKNTEDPWLITKSNNRKIYIKCQEKDYHGCYKTSCASFYRGIRCNYCGGFEIHPKDSFAQWGIDTLGEDFLEKYWDYERNTENPWNLLPQSNKKIYIKYIDKNYNGTYQISCCDFFNGNEFGYLKEFKYHPKNSFAQWGIDTLGEDFLEKYWDYEKNTEDPWLLTKSNIKKIYIKCQEKDYHSSYTITCSDFHRGYRCNYCSCKIIHPKDSFAQWGIDTLGEDFLEKYWDYEKNTEDPWLISPMSGKKVSIYCQEKKYHKSYKITCSHFNIGHRCGYCKGIKIHPKDSFAQWGIDTLGEDFLEKYWDYEKNTENPWLLTKSNIKKIYIKCQEKDYHGCYKTSCASFYRGSRCNYCRGFKTHPKDSFAQWGIDKFGVDFLEKYWDYDKNNQDPWNISRRSGSKAWFKCPNHDSYERIIDNVSRSELRCPECVRERDESFLQEKVRIFLSNLGYTTKHEYNCSLQPINPKTNHPLRYDNEVQELRLIIEVHGLQHYEFIETWHRTRKEFREYKWRDQFKKNYALKENFHYLEIPYWEEYEDKYKETIIKKIKEILKERL